MSELSVPAITPIYRGLANGAPGPATPPTCSSTAPTTGDVGSYPTSCGGAADSNYRISYATGTLAISQALTSTNVGSSSDPSMHTHDVTFTATVAVLTLGAGTPTGSVTFNDGTTSLGTVALGTNSTASFTTRALAIGAHSITASYSGDGNFTPSGAVLITQYVDTDLTGFPKLANGAYNLSNVNLSGGYLAHLSLAGASLSGSNFTNANFTGADLTRADMRNANFTGANLTGAVLTNANMSNGNVVNITKANLSGANLTGSNLAGGTGWTTATVSNVVWNSTRCPDGTASNHDGGTCAGHL